MRKKTASRCCLRTTFAIGAVALICALLQTGAEAGAGARRGHVTGASGPIWRRSRRFVASSEDGNALFTNPWYDVKRYPDNVENGIIFLTDGIQSASPQHSKSPGGSFLRPEQRSQLGLRPRKREFFENYHPSWNIDRRASRIQWDPEYWSNYQAPSERSYSSLLSPPRKTRFDRAESGAENWLSPSQRIWRHFRSLDSPSRGEFFLNSKRQPPPGFHAIRGKRNTAEEDEEEEEEDERLSNDWLQDLSQQIVDS